MSSSADIHTPTLCITAGVQTDFDAKRRLSSESEACENRKQIHNRVHKGVESIQ
jgi:hypothetical protein